MNLVPAIKEARRQISKIKVKKDNQIRNLNFAFSTLSAYCNVYPNDESYSKIGKYTINDDIHILIYDDKIYESSDSVNVIPGLKVIIEQIIAINKHYEPEIISLEEGLKKMREMNDVCENCEGTGEIKKRACAEDEGTMYTCPICHGLRKIKK